VGFAPTGTRRLFTAHTHCGHQPPLSDCGLGTETRYAVVEMLKWLPVRNPTSLAAALRITKRYDDTKERTAVRSAFRPYLPLMSLDDGAGD
jgi:hypothetical protein